MNFYLPIEPYLVITSQIKTPKGKISLSQQINYLYILHRLVWKRTFDKDEYNNGVPMNSKLLKNDLFKKGKVVTDVLTYLTNKKYIIKVKNHQKGITSARYQLHPSLDSERVYVIFFDRTDSTLIEKLEERPKKIFAGFKQLQILENDVELNQEGKLYLENKYGKLSENRKSASIAFERTDLGLIGIYYRDFFAVRPRGSRVYTNLTQLKREHRRFVNFKGQPLRLTDISNSQVLLCIPIIIEKMKSLNLYNPEHLPEDLVKFKTLCEEGKIYEFLISQSAYKGTRKTFKDKFFGQIFFCRNSSYWPLIKKTFKDTFPFVFKMITLIKEKDYKEFANQLQNFEASIMVDGVFTEMIKNGTIVLTLHDAIICSNEEDLTKAEKLIEKKLSIYFLKPNFKRESIVGKQESLLTLAA